MNKLSVLILLLSVAALNASSLYLPQSYTWQGYSFYNENDISVRLEYAVYDTANSEDMSSISASSYTNLASQGEGQFIYTYQIFTNPDTNSGYLAVDTFRLLGFDTSSILDNTTIDDGMDDVNTEGIALDASSTVDDGTSFGWNFQTVDLGEGNRSYFLTFTSDFSPIAGEYEITANDNGVSVPGTGDETGTGDQSGNDVPEPATMMLLAAGTIGLLRKKVNR